MINSFRGKYRFLSNFYPCGIEIFGFYPETLEHAYQACKCADRDEAIQILDARTAKEAKYMGRTCRLRKDWEEINLQIMFGLVFQKFTINTDIRKKLVLTKDKPLVEGNNWGDIFWGECNGLGENHLGRILMTVRSLVA